MNIRACSFYPACNYIQGFQAGLPALLSVVSKCQRMMWKKIMNSVFIKVAYVPPSFRLQRYNMNTPKSHFFRHLMSHLHFFESSKTESNWLIFSNFRAPFECNKNVYCDIGFLLVHPVKAMQIQGSSHHTCILSIQQRAMKHEFRQTMCCLV